MIKKHIKFDEALHKYTDEDNIVYTSVTTLIGRVEPKYDSEFWAVYRVLDRENWKPRPFLEERKIEVLYGKTRVKFSIEMIMNGALPVKIEHEAVLSDWEDIKDTACRWGTSKHAFLEDSLNKITDTTKITIDVIKKNTEQHGYAFKVTNKKELDNSPLKFAYPSIYREILKYIDQGWTLFSEKRVYDAEYRVAGTIDLLLVKDGMCFIIDWKTNREKLKFEPGYYKKEWNANRTKKVKTTEWVSTKDKLNYPLQSVAHCKGNTYIMQLSSYHYLCFRWGLKPLGTLLVHIRPKCDAEGEILLEHNGERIEHEPEFYTLPIWKNEVKLLFQWHKNQWENNK